MPHATILCEKLPDKSGFVELVKFGELLASCGDERVDEVKLGYNFFLRLCFANRNFIS